MAVLIGILAPQYLRFANNSRVVTDIQNAEEIARCIDVAIAESTGPVSIPATISGKGGTEVSNVKGLTTLPDSKVDSDYEWVITTDSAVGVTKIVLGGKTIYPDGTSGNEYYNDHYTN